MGTFGRVFLGTFLTLGAVAVVVSTADAAPDTGDGRPGGSPEALPVFDATVSKLIDWLDRWSIDRTDAWFEVTYFKRPRGALGDPRV